MFRATNPSQHTGYATGARPYYEYDLDNIPTPRASDFNMAHTNYVVPGHDPKLDASRSMWYAIPNSVERPTSALSTSSGGLNPQAVEFHPSRPGSVASSSSSQHSTSSASQSSGSTSRTSVGSSAVGDSPACSRATSAVPPDRWEDQYKMYRDQLRTAHDLRAPIKSIIEAGVGHFEDTKQIALMVTRLAPGAPGGPQAYHALLRSESMGLFRAYWDGANAPWTHEESGPRPYLSSRGVNIAAFLGALFRVGFVCGEDVYQCLRVLLPVHDGDLSLMPLMAVHALVNHCGPAICSQGGPAAAATALLLDSIRAKAAQWQWDPAQPRAALLQDLLDTFQGWCASAEMAQIRASVA